MKLNDIIETFIPGDWGNDAISDDNTCSVYCIRGADIEPIKNQDYTHIPQRYISQRSYDSKLLRAGDIIIEKSGGSPTQSTGRVCLITKELIAEKKAVVCSNFCVAFRVNAKWNAEYIYLYLQHIYNAGVFFNFEGKTSGIKNLQLEQAFKSIEIELISLVEQERLATVIRSIDQKQAVNRAINRNLPLSA
jgi:type I restriction enzyme S subunit